MTAPNPEHYFFFCIQDELADIYFVVVVLSLYLRNTYLYDKKKVLGLNNLKLNSKFRIDF